MINFLYPCAYFIAEVITHWRDGWRGFATALKRCAFDVWPWLPPACIIPWFYLRLSKASPRNPYSLPLNLKDRTIALARDAVLSIAPTPSVGTLFIVLLSICFIGVVLSYRKLFAQSPLRFTTLTVLIVLTLGAYLTVPDQVGNGSDIANRFLLYAALFLVVIAFTGGIIDARLLTLCSMVAAFLVVVFAGEYLLISRRLAPAVVELRSAMEGVPRHSRILILGYRMSPSCQGWPLLERAMPERHLALASTLKNELVVLNDYEAASLDFPLNYRRSMPAGVVNEVDLSSNLQRAAWQEILESDPDVDFVVSWGAPSGVNNCASSVGPPFEDALESKYDLVFSKRGASSVELWRKRG
jgi:hypothetical protein